MNWNTGNISEIDNRRAQGSDVGTHAGIIEHICGAFGVIVLDAILKLFNTLVSKCHVTLKHLTVERNRLTFRPWGLLAVHTWGSILRSSSTLTWDQGRSVQICHYCWRQHDRQSPLTSCCDTGPIVFHVVCMTCILFSPDDFRHIAFNTLFEKWYFLIGTLR